MADYGYLYTIDLMLLLYIIIIIIRDNIFNACIHLELDNNTSWSQVI